MPRVVFTSNIQRHIDCPESEVPGRTVREALEQIFEVNPAARSYVLDDQAALRKHMAIFIDGERIRDRKGLSDPVAESGTIHVIQSLTGG